MANVTLSLLHTQLKQVQHQLQELKEMHHEVHELRSILLPAVPEEEITDAERKELRRLSKEIEEGKGRPWREALKG